MLIYYGVTDTVTGTFNRLLMLPQLATVHITIIIVH